MVPVFLPTQLVCYMLFIFNFTYRPLINNKIERPYCKRPPNLSENISEDDTLREYKMRLANLLDTNFSAIKYYIRRFKHIHAFYCEDMIFDENEIRNNERIDIFREWCERYRLEETEINSLIDAQPIGIFNVKFDKFKQDALPAPNNKQRVLAEVLPE